MKEEKAMTLEDADRRNELRHGEQFPKIQKSNQHHASFHKMFAELIAKF